MMNIDVILSGRNHKWKSCTCRSHINWI